MRIFLLKWPLGQFSPLVAISVCEHIFDLINVNYLSLMRLKLKVNMKVKMMVMVIPNQSRIMYTHPLTVKLTFSLLPEGNVTLPLNYDVSSSHDNNVGFSHHTNFSSLHDDHVSSSHDNYLPSSHVPLCAAM